MAERPKTTQIALVAVLALVLTGVLSVRLGLLPTGSKKSGGPGTPAPAAKSKDVPAPAPAAKAATAKAATSWKRPDPVGPIARDPTRMGLPPEALRPKGAVDAPAAPAEPQYTVSGIVFNTEQPSSLIIDGRILREGDTIHGAVILKISEGQAQLQRDDQTWLVRPGQTYRGPEVVPLR